VSESFGPLWPRRPYGLARHDPCAYRRRCRYEQGFDAVYSVVHAASTTSTFTGNDLEGNTKLTASSAASKAAAIGLLYGINGETDFKNQASLDDYVRFIDFAKTQTDGPIYVHCAFGGASSTA
jgi:hypothetical protein